MTFFLCLLSFFLSGCMAPLLSPQTQGLLKQISVSNIPERQGQVLRQRLINAFLATSSCPKRYDLKIELTEDSYGMGIGTDARTTICHLATTARYTLTDRHCRKIIASGMLAAQNSYDVLSPTQVALANSYYSTTTSEDFCRKTNTDQLIPLFTIEMARILSNQKEQPAQEEGLFFEADKVP